MSAVDLVLIILWVEGMAVLLAVVAVVGYALFTRYESRRRRARLTRARAMLARHFEDRSIDATEMTTLRLLSRSEVIRLYVDVASNVGGSEREWLRAVAIELGLIDEAIARTRSRRWWMRLSGARLLTLTGAEPEVMRQLLNDPEAIVRAQAAGYVAQEPSADGVAGVIGMLGDPSALPRFAAKDALMRLGATATPLIVSRLGNLDDARTISLLEVATATASHAYMATAFAHVTDRRAEVRRLVARLFRGMGGAVAAAALTDMLRDDADVVREAAAEALGFLNYWPASPTVAGLLDDSVSRVRLAAALSLDRLGPPGELLLRRARVRGSNVAAMAARRILDDPSRLRGPIATSATR